MGLSDVEVVESDFYDFIGRGDERVQQAVDVRRVRPREIGRLENALVLAVGVAENQTVATWNKQNRNDVNVNSLERDHF